METPKAFIESINKLITKHNDLNAKFLSFSVVAEGVTLKGMLRHHADMHRFFSLQLVHDFKTYVPEAQLELNRTLANAIEMGWEDIKSSLGFHNDKDLEKNLAEEHRTCANLSDEVFLQTKNTMPNLKATLEEQIAWHKKVSEHLPEIDD
tara:strand:- start:873 stop:1322 length:450 start_codon:yes stop_codon:yes gene_type:complete